MGNFAYKHHMSFPWCTFRPQSANPRHCTNSAPGVPETNTEMSWGPPDHPGNFHPFFRWVEWVVAMDESSGVKKNPDLPEIRGGNFQKMFSNDPLSNPANMWNIKSEVSEVPWHFDLCHGQNIFFMAYGHLSHIGNPYNACVCIYI